MKPCCQIVIVICVCVSIYNRIEMQRIKRASLTLTLPLCAFVSMQKCWLKI